MTRVLALVAIVAALLLSGTWVAQRQAEDGVAAAEAAAGAQAQAGAAVVDAPAGQEGFVPVPTVSDEPVRVFDAPEPVLREGVDYRALLRTSRGDLVVDLFQDRAPRTVNNFVFLALHRFYQGVPFHRVLDGFMAQTGDPTGTGTGGPGYTFEDEIHPELRHDRRGLLSMANAGPNTNGSQFFITFGPAPWLDGRHGIFGEVVEGEDVLEALTRIDPDAPQVVAHLDDPLSEMAAQGVEVPDDADRTVGGYLREELGAVPVQGQSFHLAGRRGVLGTIEGQQAIGLYPLPDVLESVTVLASGGADEAPDGPSDDEGEREPDDDSDAEPDAEPDGGSGHVLDWPLASAPHPTGARDP